MNLNEIQKNLKAPKNKRNTFGNYDYRNCEGILEAVKPLLGESVLLLTDELVMLGERYYIKATASLKDETGVTEVTAYARESETKKGMDESQITGTASSYARKYALNGLFLIDDTKDADSDEYQKTTKEETIPSATAKAIIDLADLKGVKVSDICKAYKVESVYSFTEEQAGKVKAQLMKKANKVTE